MVMSVLLFVFLSATVLTSNATLPFLSLLDLLPVRRASPGRREKSGWLGKDLDKIARVL